MRYFILSRFLLFSFTAVAQLSIAKDKITGKVIDSETKLPIEMAIVSIYRIGEASAFYDLSTDRNGAFSIG